MRDGVATIALGSSCVTRSAQNMAFALQACATVTLAGLGRAVPTWCLARTHAQEMASALWLNVTATRAGRVQTVRRMPPR